VASAVLCHTWTAGDVTELSPPAHVTLTCPIFDGSVVRALHVTVDTYPARVTHTVVAANGTHQAIDTLLLTGGTKPALSAAETDTSPRVHSKTATAYNIHSTKYSIAVTSQLFNP